MTVSLQLNAATTPFAAGGNARAMLATDSPPAPASLKIPQQIKPRFDTMLVAATPNADASAAEPRELSPFALSRAVPLKAKARAVTAMGQLVATKPLSPAPKRHPAKNGTVPVATFDTPITTMPISPPAALPLRVLATAEKSSTAPSSLMGSDLAPSRLAGGAGRQLIFATAQTVTVDDPAHSIPIAAPNIPGVAAAWKLAKTSADAARPPYPDTAPGSGGPLRADNPPPVDDAVLPATSALLEISTSLTMASKARPEPAAAPAAVQIITRHPAPRLELGTADAPAAADTRQQPEIMSFGMATAAPSALPVADAPASPRPPDRLPSAAGTLADAPVTTSGEPGFSIDSQLLGPVSAALIPLTAAGDRLHVQFIVDRPATAALITGGTDRLDLTLGATGMRLEKLSVEVDRTAEVTTPPPGLAGTSSRTSSATPSSESQSAGSSWTGSHAATAQHDTAPSFDQRSSRQAPLVAPDTAVQPLSPQNPVASPRDRFA